MPPGLPHRYRPYTVLSKPQHRCHEATKQIAGAEMSQEAGASRFNLSDAEGGRSPQTPSPSTQAPQQLSARPVPRSCYSCKRKKIRCDKREPCLPCTRACTPCEYPPLGPRIRRAKRTIIAEMSSRIADLEKTLATARSEETPRQATPSIESEDIPSHLKNALYYGRRSRQDVLIQKGSSSQYFNEIMFSRVIKEVSRIVFHQAMVDVDSDRSHRSKASNLF